MDDKLTAIALLVGGWTLVVPCLVGATMWATVQVDRKEWTLEGFKTFLLTAAAFGVVVAAILGTFVP